MGVIDPLHVPAGPAARALAPSSSTRIKAARRARLQRLSSAAPTSRLPAADNAQFVGAPTGRLLQNVMGDSGGTFGKIKVAAAGTGAYDANATRWGDYSFAALDPSGQSFWLATEYIPPHASQTLDGLRNWGTRVFQVDVHDN